MNAKGKLGEDCAANFLEAKGYSIVARNFRIRSAEIDIIAKLDDLLIFVEVKARSDIRHGLPREAVTINKQKKSSRRQVYSCRMKNFPNALAVST